MIRPSAENKKERKKIKESEAKKAVLLYTKESHRAIIYTSYFALVGIFRERERERDLFDYCYWSLLENISFFLLLFFSFRYTKDERECNTPYIVNACYTGIYTLKDVYNAQMCRSNLLEYIHSKANIWPSHMQQDVFYIFIYYIYTVYKRTYALYALRECIYKESRIPQRSFLLMMIYRRATGHSKSNFLFKKSPSPYYDHFHAS